MTVTDMLPANADRHAETFPTGQGRIPTTTVAVVTCMDGRIEQETGMRPPFRIEAFSDLEEPVRAPVDRIGATPSSRIETR